MIFSQHAHPRVNHIHIVVGLGKALLNLWVRRDIGKRINRWQAHINSNLVVVGQPMIATALNIQGCQIESARARLPENGPFELPEGDELLRLCTAGLADALAPEGADDRESGKEHREPGSDSKPTPAAAARWAAAGDRPRPEWAAPPP